MVDAHINSWTELQLSGLPPIDELGIPPHKRRAVVACHIWEGSNGYAGARALRRMGWEVNIINEFTLIPLQWRLPITRVIGRAVRGLAVKEYGQRIVQLVADTGASLFLAFKGTFIPPEAIRRLRERGVLTICHYPDVSVTTHGPWLRDNLREYDWVFTTKTFGVKDMEREAGVTDASVLLHGFDPDIHRPLPEERLDRSRYGCDVSFIGTWHQPKQQLLSRLQRSLPGLHLRIWGGQWDKCKDQALGSAVEGHQVEGQAYATAIQCSMVNLVILSGRIPGASSGDQVTSRTFHIPAAGGLMLHQRTPEFLELFEDGRDALTFSDDDELHEIIKAIMNNDIEVSSIREAGMRKVWSRDSWDHRIVTMLEHPVFNRLRAC